MNSGVSTPPPTGNSHPALGLLYIESNRFVWAAAVPGVGRGKVNSARYPSLSMHSEYLFLFANPFHHFSQIIPSILLYQIPLFFPSISFAPHFPTTASLPASLSLYPHTATHPSSFGVSFLPCPYRKSTCKRGFRAH